jgi:hypothetical protein
MQIGKQIGMLDRSGRVLTDKLEDDSLLTAPVERSMSLHIHPIANTRGR